MIRTNKGNLVIKSVMGEIDNPTLKRSVYTVSPHGEPVILPSVGGITYNVRIGDPATGWQADHVEPGVSIKNAEKDGHFSANVALNVLSCIGNEAKVVSGEAKGERGVVTGKHGGIEHVLIDFEPKILDALLIGDKILIRAVGLGLTLIDFPHIRAMNIDPDLVEKMPLQVEGDILGVPVTHTVPAVMMGSGLGSSHTYSGDYDIQLKDPMAIQETGLEDLRLGDVVALMDADHTYGRVFRTGAVSIGVVVHSDCVVSGHGPGVTTIFTSSEGKIRPIVDPAANIVTYVGLRAKSSH